MSKRKSKTLTLEDNGLNANYTFKNFVVGPSNKLAFMVSKIIAARPGHQYNPLFIYGDLGLGKTHLLHAIGNSILNKNSKAKICCVSAEQFVQELISALRHEQMEEFRQRFRKNDVLLLDGLDYIANKPTTQDELFHIFDSLYETNCQIVFTCHRSPLEISGLAERLRSKISGSLRAEIQPPELETRTAFILKKATALGLRLPKTTTQFIASHAVSNRELEGYLIRLEAYVSIYGKRIDMAMVKSILEPSL